MNKVRVMGVFTGFAFAIAIGRLSTNYRYALYAFLKHKLCAYLDIKPTFALRETERCLLLKYGDKNQYQIRLPFEQSNIHKALNHRVYLVMSDGTRTDITQQPGVAYLLKASDMGGVRIELYNCDTELTTDIGNSIPDF